MSIDNIGVVCVVLELAKSVSDKFWVNICDEQFDIPGIIEFSNLRTVKNNIVYVPYYMPITNPKYFDTDEVFLRKCMHYIKIINPDIKEEDLINHHIGRLKFSQPICTPGFKSRLPSICSSINHLQIADTSYYYPEDRGFSESIKLGRLMANNLVQKNKSQGELMVKKALITGACGQDGAYLAASLVAEGYYVVGITRRSSQDFMWRHEALNLTGKIDIRSIDVTEQSAVLELFQKERFDEVYNLAAQSFVGASWDAPVSTTMVNSLGVLYLLEAIKRFSPETKMYQASTSEMFGLIQESVQNEDTKLYPRSPYAVSKVFAHQMLINYRESLDYTYVLVFYLIMSHLFGV